MADVIHARFARVALWRICGRREAVHGAMSAAGEADVGGGGGHFVSATRIIGVFRVTFFRAKSSDFRTLSDLPPNLVVNHSTSESSNIPPLKITESKNKFIFKYSNIRIFVDYSRDYFR